MYTFLAQRPPYQLYQIDVFHKSGSRASARELEAIICDVPGLNRPVSMISLLRPRPA